MSHHAVPHIPVGPQHLLALPVKGQVPTLAPHLQEVGFGQGSLSKVVAVEEGVAVEEAVAEPEPEPPPPPAEAVGCVLPPPDSVPLGVELRVLEGVGEEDTEGVARVGR